MSSPAVTPETGSRLHVLVNFVKRRPLLTLAAATALAHLVLHAAAPAARAAGQGAVITAWALAPLLALPVWAAWRCVALLAREAIAAEPASRYVLTAHVGKIALQMLAFAAGVTLSGLWVFHRAMGVAELAEALPIPAVDWFFRLVVSGELLFIAAIVLLLPLVQLGYVLSQMGDGMRRLLFLWGFALSIWVLLRTAPYLAQPLVWLPDVTFRQLATAGPRFRFAFGGVETAPFAATVLLSALAHAAATAALPIARQHVQNPPPKSRLSQRISDRLSVTPREKVLLTFMAISFLAILDVGFNGRQVIRGVPAFFVQPPRASAAEALLSPFVIDGGTLIDPEPGFHTLVVKTQGDLLVLPSATGSFRADYALWTTAIDAEEALRLAEESDVILQRSGPSAELLLQAPPSRGERGLVRATYRLELPPGVALRIEGDGSTVSIHQTEGDIDIEFASGILQLSDIQGSLRIVGREGDIYLSNIAGDVHITQRDGVAEIHGVGGTLHFDGDYVTAGISDVGGPVTALLRRGTGSFAHLRQGIALSAQMAEVSVGAVEGFIEYRGAISPARFSPLRGPAQLESDRGNVLLRLDSATPWELRLSSTAAISSSLPEGIAPAPQRSGRTTTLEGSVNGGGVPLSAVVRGAQLRVEAL